MWGEKDGEDCKWRDTTIRIPLLFKFLWATNERGIAPPIRRGDWERQERLEAHKTNKSENLQGDLVVDGRIILKSKLKEWKVKTWTGFIELIELCVWPMGGTNEN
jgi:hypothetical protein